jgi:transposase
VEKLLERHVQRNQVQAVVIDLAEPERQAIHTVLPRAAIIADKFHVVALAHQALLEVRGGRRLPGNVERLRPEDGERLTRLLTQDGLLKQAWLLKEGLRGVYRVRTPARAAGALQVWLQDANTSGLRPFVRTARTLTKWQEEVLNYWRYPLTNAMVEGKHNRVKVLKRRAYGYRNDRTFSLRILNLFPTD